MKIPGWAYLLVGIIVGGVSGYIYKFIPKNGQPNGAMAVFFFIGMIFILVGIVKLFFKKMDVQAEASSVVRETSFKDTPTPLSKEQQINRVEQQITRAYQRENPQKQHTTQVAQHTQHSMHTSNYARAHPYQGAHQSTAQSTHQTTSHPQYTIVQCKKCNAKNHSTSNYCHICGNGLR